MPDFLAQLLSLAIGTGLGLLLGQRRAARHRASLRELSQPDPPLHLGFFDVREQGSILVLATTGGEAAARVTGLHAVRPDGSAYPLLDRSRLPVSVGASLVELGRVGLGRLSQGEERLCALRVELSDREVEISAPDVIDRLFECARDLSTLHQTDVIPALRAGPRREGAKA